MRHQAGELHGAVWLYLVHPVAVQVGYLKAGATSSGTRGIRAGRASGQDRQAQPVLRWNGARRRTGSVALHHGRGGGVWFTGAATFAAVVVSLMLARREGIRIKGLGRP